MVSNFKFRHPEFFLPCYLGWMSPDHLREEKTLGLADPWMADGRIPSLGDGCTGFCTKFSDHKQAWSGLAACSVDGIQMGFWVPVVLFIQGLFRLLVTVVWVVLPHLQQVYK